MTSFPPRPFEGYLIGRIAGGRQLAREVVLMKSDRGQFDLIIGVNQNEFDAYVVPLSRKVGKQFLAAMGPQEPE